MLQSPWTPIFLTACFIGVSVARTIWVRRMHGINAYVIDHSDPILGFAGAMFGTVVAGYLLSLLASAAMPNWTSYAGRLDWLGGEFTRTLSLILMISSTVWIAWAQMAMGASWRIGIPKADAPPLRTNGPFRMSRNPIFLGMLLFAGGLSLWEANAVTVCLLAVRYVALEVQIRCEEVFLARTHGEFYRAYKSRVRRWI